MKNIRGRSRRCTAATRVANELGALFRIVEARRRGRMGGLSQDPDHVVEVGHGAHPAVPPHRIDHVGDDAWHFLHGEAIGHRRTHHVDARRHPGMDVRVDRIGEWRQEDTRPSRPCLVVVVDDLREPLAVQNSRHRTGLRHVVHEPVAVVVVADIVMVELGRPRRLERCLEILSIPIGNDVEPIRVHARHEEQDHVVADLLHLRGIFGHDAISEMRHHLGRRDLGRVQAGIEPNDRFAFGRVARGGLIIDARAREGLAHLTPLVEPREIGLARDIEQQKRFLEDGAPDLTKLDAIARGVESPVILDELVPFRELVVRAWLEADDVRRLRNLGRYESGQKDRNQENGYAWQGGLLNLKARMCRIVSNG